MSRGVAAGGKLEGTGAATPQERKETNFPPSSLVAAANDSNHFRILGKQGDIPGVWFYCAFFETS